MYFGCSQTRRNFDTLRLDLRLVRALAENGCVSLVLHLQELVILSRLAVPAFSLHLHFWVLQWWKLVEIRNTQNETGKTTPN